MESSISKNQEMTFTEQQKDEMVNVISIHGNREIYNVFKNLGFNDMPIPSFTTS